MSDCMKCKHIAQFGYIDGRMAYVCPKHMHIKTNYCPDFICGKPINRTHITKRNINEIRSGISEVKHGNNLI